MGLIILRCLFLVVSAGLGISIVRCRRAAERIHLRHVGGVCWHHGFMAIVVPSAWILLVRRKRIETISADLLRPDCRPAYDHGSGTGVGAVLAHDAHWPRTLTIAVVHQCGDGRHAVLRLHQHLDADERRLPLHHPLCRVRQGSQRAQALHPRHQRCDRRPNRRRCRDGRFRRATHHAQVRDRRTTGRGRQFRSFAPRPWSARARHPQPAAKQQEHRTGHLRARPARVCRACRSI